MPDEAFTRTQRDNMNAWRKEKAWREQVKYDEATPETRAFLDQNAKRMFVKEYKIVARFSHFYTAARGRSAIYRRTLGDARYVRQCWGVVRGLVCEIRYDVAYKPNGAVVGLVPGVTRR